MEIAKICEPVSRNKSAWQDLFLTVLETLVLVVKTATCGSYEIVVNANFGRVVICGTEPIAFSRLRLSATAPTTLISVFGLGVL